MKRRRFLQIFTALIVGGLSSVVALERTSSIKKYIWNHIHPHLDENAPLGTLLEDKMNTVVALAEVIIPPDETLNTQDRNNFVRSFVDQRVTHMRGYLKEYERAVNLLDERASETNRGKRFAELNLQERDQVLGSLLLRYRADEGRKPGLAIVLHRKQEAFREFVVRDIITAYLQSPRGYANVWSIVGYTHYPGVPSADPRDYTRPVVE